MRTWHLDKERINFANTDAMQWTCQLWNTAQSRLNKQTQEQSIHSIKVCLHVLSVGMKCQWMALVQRCTHIFHSHSCALLFLPFCHSDPNLPVISWFSSFLLLIPAFHQLLVHPAFLLLCIPSDWICPLLPAYEHGNSDPCRDWEVQAACSYACF